jgi:HPt (histidine-containing phosphotransfer) domain-containing protein
MSEERPVAYVDAVLAPLVPKYLERRRADIVTAREAVGSGDFGAISVIGHGMKGSGGGYGFDQVTECGGDLEAAAQAQDAVAVLGTLERLEHYLDAVVIEIVEEED